MFLEINEQELQELEYRLLPGKCPPRFKHLDIYNQAYVYWKNFWSEILRGLGTMEPLAADDFMRQDVIPVFLHKGRVVAMHLYTVFDLQQVSTVDHRYFLSNFTTEFINHLKARKALQVMSMEYLTVDSDWRKARTGLSLATLLVGLALKVLDYTDSDVAVGPARNDLKVSDITYDFGCECLAKNVTKHNVSCDLIAGFRNRIKRHPDPKIEYYVNYFWDKKIDLRSPEKTLKIVA